MMRGYFAIGAEGISKPANVGSIVRSAHAFGASFAFTIRAATTAREMRVSDTSDAAGHLPLYHYSSIEEFTMPKGCVLVGVELLDEAIDLPSFRHPLQAAYILGPEKGSLSPEVLAKCAYTIKIPTRFCVNVGVAGALVMYDRMLSFGRFATRPVRTGGPVEGLPEHIHGPQKVRTGAS